MDDLARGILNAFGIATASPAKEDSDGKVTSGGTSQDSVQHYGKVSYQSHIRDIGWACWQSDGRMSGTTGQNRRIEAFRLVPVGETDVVVHIKDVGDKEYLQRHNPWHHRTEQAYRSNQDCRQGYAVHLQSPPEKHRMDRLDIQWELGWHKRKRIAN